MASAAGWVGLWHYSSPFVSNGSFFCLAGRRFLLPIFSLCEGWGHLFVTALSYCLPMSSAVVVPDPAGRPNLGPCGNSPAALLRSLWLLSCARADLPPSRVRSERALRCKDAINHHQIRLRAPNSRSPRATMPLTNLTNTVDSFASCCKLEHPLSAIRFVTPEQRRRGEGRVLLASRNQFYDLARVEPSERWSGKTRNWQPIVRAWSNQKRPNVGCAPIARPAKRAGQNRIRRQLLEQTPAYVNLYAFWHRKRSSCGSTSAD